MIDVNAKSKEIFENNKAVGWWDDMNRCIYTTLQLINTEIAEATEGERKNLMDDHLPHRKMGEVELADALIRTLDVVGRMGIEFNLKGKLEPMIEEIKMYKIVGSSISAAHLILTNMVCTIARYVDIDDPYKDRTFKISGNITAFNRLVAGLFATAELYGYDIVGAMNEKLEYNKQRADHKRENRAKAEGKKF